MATISKNNIHILPADCFRYGLSYREWTAKWWQWALSIPLENNPINDRTGQMCSVNQSGPVWFLAGTTGGMANRFCSIPAEKAILLPILNHGGTLADSPTVSTGEQLLSRAMREMDVISDIEVTVDGLKLSRLEEYRVTSPIFDVVLPNKNLFGGSPGPTKGASDGYWLFLDPLPMGEHNIRSFGSCLSGRIKIGVNYNIISV